MNSGLSQTVGTEGSRILQSEISSFENVKSSEVCRLFNQN